MIDACKSCGYITAIDPQKNKEMQFLVANYSWYIKEQNVSVSENKRNVLLAKLGYLKLARVLNEKRNK